MAALKSFIFQAIGGAYKSVGGRKPTYLTSATSVLTSVKVVSVVPSGYDKTDVCRENMDVRWVGVHPLQFMSKNSTSHLTREVGES